METIADLCEKRYEEMKNEPHGEMLVAVQNWPPNAMENLIGSQVCVQGSAVVSKEKSISIVEECRDTQQNIISLRQRSDNLTCFFVKFARV